MVDPIKMKAHIVRLLKDNHVAFKLYSHNPVLSYEDAAEAQKETGYIGTEGKSLVLSIDNNFIVYVTVQGSKVNFDAIKAVTGTKKVRLATAEELKDKFGAEPGCAYPFGFEARYPIYVDPHVFEQQWFLFSPCLPTFTVQAEGAGLESLFRALPNTVSVTNALSLQ